jgi:hypothetical protein
MGAAMTKDQFDQLLHSLKNPPQGFCSDYSDPDPINRITNQTIPEIWECPFQVMLPTAIAIMESDIFYEGQLKGKRLTGGKNRFKLYPINDFQRFLWSIAAPFEPAISMGVSALCLEEPPRMFDKLLEDLADMTCLAEIYKGKRVAKRMAAIGKELEDIKKDISSNITPPANPIGIVKIIDHLISTFKAHIPDAPDQTIANSISDLLQKYDMPVKAKAILQRMFRAKNKSSGPNPS